MANYTSGSGHYRWKEGKTISGGYAVTKKWGHPRASRFGYVKDHILVVESVMGSLPNGAVIHHVNGVKTDNRKQNLVVCENESYHQQIHRRLRAFLDCGHAAWRKCKYCKQYDNPDNLYISPDGYQAKHRECHSSYMSLKRKDFKL